MIIFKKSIDLHEFLVKKKEQQCSLGFVPTMGALHEGHISLVNLSRAHNSLTICSIFVNPTQFNNPEDFKKYPISIDSDINMLEHAGCDILFLPVTDEIYPAGYVRPHYELGFLENTLEGLHRPGHFQGVCMVVDRLLQIIPCDNLYLGRKDFQQCMVIDAMAKKLHPAVKLLFAPTVREADGLAMSSRNRRLGDTDRIRSAAIYRALQQIKENIMVKGVDLLIDEARKSLQDQGFVVDYVAITDNELKPAFKLTPDSEWTALVAASIGNIRLIDNMQLHESKSE